MWATGRIYEIAAAYAAVPSVTAEALRGHVLAEALALAEEDVSINSAIAEHGNSIVPQGANILHHWCARAARAARAGGQAGYASWTRRTGRRGRLRARTTARCGR